MTVLVTGANGHVGANLVRELLRRGQRVRALVHRDTRALDGLPVEYARGDVCVPSSLRAAFAGVEVVYHLAAVISIDGDRGGVVPAVNVHGVRHVAEAARAAGVRRLVHCSSVHAFSQEPLDQPLDERRAPATQPHYPAYDRSKAAGEMEIRAAIGRGLDAVIINPTGIIGPYDFGPSRMGRWLRSLCEARLPALVDGGFDWVDVRDVARAAIAAAARGRTGANYLVAGHWHSLRELAQLSAEVIGGLRGRLLETPMWLARIGAPFAVAGARLTGREPLFTREALHALRANRCVRRDRATQELQHTPRPMRETLADLHAWFAARGVVRPAGHAADPVRASIRAA
jgi:dihydroflavonol-4-reductase